MKTENALLHWLQQHGKDAAPVVPLLNSKKVAHIDLSGANPLFQTVEMKDTHALHDIVWGEMARLGVEVGVGGYDEDRSWYQRSGIFATTENPNEARSIHLGVDIWVEAGSDVCAPLAGKVHSFKDNANFGDYGPTIILEHEWAPGKVFYTLYGHLSRTSLPALSVGKVFRAGEKIAEIGPPPENGDWPPHLHLQLITDMLGKEADFIGVSSRAERERYLSLCPDPNLLLNLEVLRR